MKLFAFGLGYCARDFIARFGASFDEIAGTVRSAAKAQEIAGENIEALVFGPEGEDPAIAQRLADADALLVSIPPGVSVDPVLARFGHRIAGLRRPQTIIYLSTIGVYGDRQGEWVDEALAPAPSSTRSQARLQAEKSWAAIGKSKDKRVRILRLAGIYGPGRNALANLRAGSARRLVKTDQVFNRIHVEDVSRAIAAALLYEGPDGVFNVSDDAPAPPQDVVTFAAMLMGVEPPPEQDVATAEMTPLTRSFYAENKRASNRKLKEELGVELAFPTYRVGLEALWEAGEGRD
ncbi:SDR family oxidoreductase [Methylocapsa polymorpha]|uniref:SDR family oxidoreductase n=1 Tax=Methylocapsa polymorpha TaxID=3080828 RepID=A0ABZ0HSI2_9HYPH|nr:SDR family oxidoreductase [Methylocapsa sp. RX1]